METLLLVVNLVSVNRWDRLPQIQGRPHADMPEHFRLALKSIPNEDLFVIA